MLRYKGEASEMCHNNFEIYQIKIYGNNRTEARVINMNLCNPNNLTEYDFIYN